MCEKGAGHPLSNWQIEKEGSKDAHTRTSVNAIEKRSVHLHCEGHVPDWNFKLSFFYFCLCMSSARVLYLF